VEFDHLIDENSIEGRLISDVSAVPWPGLAVKSLGLFPTNRVSGAGPRFDFFFLGPLSWFLTYPGSVPYDFAPFPSGFTLRIVKVFWARKGLAWTVVSLGRQSDPHAPDSK
jgi:hypothetical protein